MTVFRGKYFLGEKNILEIILNFLRKLGPKGGWIQSSSSSSAFSISAPVFIKINSVFKILIIRHYFQYVRDELKASNINRHSSLHRSDASISVEELWNSWVQSEVHNWTTDEVVNWLTTVVRLPQYEKAFREKQITGKLMPRLATDQSTFLHKELGIDNVKHRKKIYLRASDVILFGIPEGKFFELPTPLFRRLLTSNAALKVSW